MTLSCSIFRAVLKNHYSSVLMLKTIEIMQIHKRNPQLLNSPLIAFHFNPELYVLGSLSPLGADMQRNLSTMN